MDLALIKVRDSSVAECNFGVEISFKMFRIGDECQCNVN